MLEFGYKAIGNLRGVLRTLGKEGEQQSSLSLGHFYFESMWEDPYNTGFENGLRTESGKWACLDWRS